MSSAAGKREARLQEAWGLPRDLGAPRWLEGQRLQNGPRVAARGHPSLRCSCWGHPRPPSQGPRGPCGTLPGLPGVGRWASCRNRGDKVAPGPSHGASMGGLLPGATPSPPSPPSWAPFRKLSRPSPAVWGTGRGAPALTPGSMCALVVPGCSSGQPAAPWLSAHCSRKAAGSSRQSQRVCVLAQQLNPQTRGISARTGHGADLATASLQLWGGELPPSEQLCGHRTPALLGQRGVGPNGVGPGELSAGLSVCHNPQHW